MTTIVCNDQTKEFFFSTTHSTPKGMESAWVPVSWSTRTREDIKAREESYGSVEIPHPIPEYQA